MDYLMAPARTKLLPSSPKATIGSQKPRRVQRTQIIQCSNCPASGVGVWPLPLWGLDCCGTYLTKTSQTFRELFGVLAHGAQIQSLAPKLAKGAVWLKGICPRAAVESYAVQQRSIAC